MGDITVSSREFIGLGDVVGGVATVVGVDTGTGSAF